MLCISVFYNVFVVYNAYYVFFMQCVVPSPRTSILWSLATFHVLISLKT